MLSVSQLNETNASLQSLHNKLPNYRKLDVKNRLSLLNCIWNPTHISNPTRYTLGIQQIHLKAARFANGSHPLPTSPPISTEQQRIQTIKYQNDISTISEITPHLIELHIFYLQAMVDLFLEGEISTPDLSSTQLLYRIYDHLVRYLTADLLTASTMNKVTHNQATSPSMIQFIPHYYLADILTDLFSSPALIHSLSILQPTYRSLLLSPRDTPNRYHNIFTLLYSVCYDKLKIFSSSSQTTTPVLNHIVKRIITAFPTLLGGFIHVCTHSGIDLEDLGQLLLDLWLLRGYGFSHSNLQEQVYIDITLTTLFTKWTNISIQTISKRQLTASLQSSPSTPNKAENYLKLGPKWLELMSLPQNLMRSILDLYSIDQIADKLMRKAQWLTRKKQIEFSERFKNKDSSALFNENDPLSQPFIDNDTNIATHHPIIKSRPMKPKKSLDDGVNFRLGDDRGGDDDGDADSRAGDFDEFSDDGYDGTTFDADGSHGDRVYNEYDDELMRPKKNKVPSLVQKTPTKTIPNISQLNKPTPSHPTPTLTTPIPLTFQPNDFDIDEAKVFQQVDQYVLYQPHFSPRYTNSQQYLLQLTIQKPTLMDDIDTLVREFDAFNVVIEIDHQGDVHLEIRPPRRHKVIEMNQDDLDYLQRAREQQFLQQQRARLVKEGKLDPQASVQDIHQLLLDYAGAAAVANSNLNLDTLSIADSFGQTYRSQNTILSGAGRNFGSQIYDPLTSPILRSPLMNNGFDGTLSIFSGRSGVTLGGGVGSTTGSLMLTSTTSRHTMKSLMSYSAMNGQSSTGSPSGPNHSLGFLASPISTTTPSSSNKPSTPALSPRGGMSSPTSPTGRTAGSTGVSSRNSQFTFAQPTNAAQNELTSHTPTQQQPPQPQPQQPSGFVLIMNRFHKSRLTRTHNTYIHPNQRRLIALLEQQAASMDQTDQQSNQQSFLLKHNPWQMVITEGEGLSEWSPVEQHYFSTVLRMLPLYPLLVPFTNGFAPLLASHQPSPYAESAKLLHLLFGRRIGRREFVIEGFSAGNIHSLIKAQDFGAVQLLFKKELELLSQILFMAGTALEQTLIRAEEDYPTMNFASYYSDLIDSSSSEFHDSSQYSTSVSQSQIVTYGGYIQSIRSLYSLLKFVMGKCIQIVRCTGSIDERRYKTDMATYETQNTQREETLAQLRVQAKQDYENELEIYRNTASAFDSSGGDNEQPPEYIGPLVPEVSPTPDQISAKIKNESVLYSDRHIIEEVAFQSYYWYQRFFAFSPLSLPTRSYHAYHMQLASKIPPKGQVNPPVPDINWTRANPDTSYRSHLTLYPQNNIVSMQLALHEHLREHKQQLIIQQLENIPTTTTASPSPKNVIPMLHSTPKGPLPSSNLRMSTSPIQTQPNQTQAQGLAPGLKFGSLPITPELQRTITATDRILHFLFPHYKTDPTEQQKQQSTAEDIIPEPSPERASNTNYCVNRQWITFDLLMDCHTLAKLLKLNLLIDQDCDVLVSAPKSKTQETSTPFTLPTINLSTIALYYLDIFDVAVLMQDSDGTELSQIQFDVDGTATYTDKKQKPSPGIQNTHLPSQNNSFGDNYDDDDVDDDIRAITQNKSGAITSAYTQDRDDDIAAHRRHPQQPFGTPTKNRFGHDRHRGLDSNEQQIPFVYKPDFDDDAGDDAGDDDNRPQLLTAHSMRSPTSSNSGGHGDKQVQIAKQAIDSPDELKNDSDPVAPPVLTISLSQKSRLEEEYEHNNIFKCIQRDDELLLFEYVKPLNHSKLDEFLVPKFYNDFGKATLFAQSLGGPSDKSPQRSTVGRRVATTTDVARSRQTTAPTQSVDDSALPTDSKKKKSWFRL